MNSAIISGFLKSQVNVRKSGDYEFKSVDIWSEKNFHTGKSLSAVDVWTIDITDTVYERLKDVETGTFAVFVGYFGQSYSKLTGRQYVTFRATRCELPFGNQPQKLPDIFTSSFAYIKEQTDKARYYEQKNKKEAEEGTQSSEQDYYNKTMAKDEKADETEVKYDGIKDEDLPF